MAQSYLGVIFGWDEETRVSALAGLNCVAAILVLAGCNGVSPSERTNTNLVDLASKNAVPEGAFPYVRFGLWQRTTIAGVAPGMSRSEQVCVGAKSEPTAAMYARFGRDCESRFSRPLDGSVTVDLICRIGEKGSWKTKVTFKGDFNSRYTAVMKSKGTNTSVKGLDGEYATTRRLTWIGPCAPGQKEGDVIFSNGVKQNMLNGERGPVGAQ